MKNKKVLEKRIILGVFSAALFTIIGIPSVMASEISPTVETLCRKFPLNSKCQSLLTQASAIELNLETKVEPFKDESLCRKFSLNSRCDDYQGSQPQETLHTINRESFCRKFPLNSQCQESVIKVFELNLNRSGEEDEWVRIEQQDNRVKLLHTTQVEDALVSQVLNSGLELIPIPIPLPLPELNKYSWDDHNTMQVAFKSDRCRSKKCIISGKDTLVFPQGVDVYGGEFTIDYREEGLERSVSFRVPPQVKAKTEEMMTVRFNN